MTPSLHVVGDASAVPLLRAALADGSAAFHVDLAGTAEADAVARLCEALRFPAWTGHTWDAVEDGLTDLSWLPTQPRVLVLDGLPGQALGVPAWADMLVELAATAVRWWARTDTPMMVLVIPRDGA
jgi:hypothetical protein